MNTPLREIIYHQTMQFYGLLNASFFEKGINIKRWKHVEQIKFLNTISVGLFWILLITGCLGTIFLFSNGLKTATIALFLVYYIFMLWIVGFNPRFYVQVIPFLTISSAYGLQKLTAQAGSFWRKLYTFYEFTH